MSRVFRVDFFRFHIRTFPGSWFLGKFGKYKNYQGALCFFNWLVPIMYYISRAGLVVLAFTLVISLTSAVPIPISTSHSNLSSGSRQDRGLTHRQPNHVPISIGSTITPVSVSSVCLLSLTWCLLAYLHITEHPSGHRQSASAPEHRFQNQSGFSCMFQGTRWNDNDIDYLFHN